MTRSREAAVPVEMGSARHLSIMSGDVVLTRARFPAGAVLERHVHDRPTFALILEGGFDLQFSNAAMRRREFQCGPGTIFTEPTCEPHVNNVFDTGASVVVIQPDPRSELFELSADLLDGVHHFRHGRIQRLGQRLRREIARPDPLSRIAAEALALDMLVEGARLEPAKRTPAPPPGWLRRVEELVHDRFRDRLTISEIAAEVGVHPSHLATAFRRRHGVPLGSYMRGLRLDWATGRLAAGSESISEVAYKAGFADQAHLTRAFKRAMGTTPARYRRRKSHDENCEAKAC